MNRNRTALFCAALTLVCLAGAGESAQAQVYINGATAGYSSYPNVPVYGTSYSAYGMSGYSTYGLGGGCCGSSYGGYPGYASGYGYGYGAYAGSGCGYRGCGLFGGYYRSSRCNPCATRTCGTCGPYGHSGCSTVGYASYGPSYGYGGCVSRRCGYRSTSRHCCGVASPVVAAACCAPAPNCCATMSGSTVMSQPVPAAPVPGNDAPMPTYNTTPMPTPAPAAPTPAAPAPEPAAPKPGV